MHKQKQNIFFLCVKTQLMGRWSRAVELSWVTSGQGDEVVLLRGRAAKTSVQKKKCGCPPLTFFDLCYPLNLWPQIFPPPPPHPFQASALIDNTPSIWRWRTTHTGTVKQLSGKETAFYLLWVLCFLFVFFFCFLCFYMRTFVHVFITGCSFFTMYHVHRGWVEGSRGGTPAWGSECDVSVTGLRPTSLKHTCMQTSTHTRTGEACMEYKGG